MMKNTMKKLFYALFNHDMCGKSIGFKVRDKQVSQVFGILQQVADGYGSEYCAYMYVLKSIL